MYSCVNSVKKLKQPPFYKITCFKNWSFQNMPITKHLLLNWYCSMKIFFGKIRMIFDIETWLWKSKFCKFWQHLLNWTHDLIFFIGLVIGLEHKGSPCKLCDCLSQKLGHTNLHNQNCDLEWMLLFTCQQLILNLRILNFFTQWVCLFSFRRSLFPKPVSWLGLFLQLLTARRL